MALSSSSSAAEGESVSAREAGVPAEAWSSSVANFAASAAASFDCDAGAPL